MRADENGERQPDAGRAVRSGCDSVSTRNFTPYWVTTEHKHGERDRRQDDGVGDRMPPHVAREERNRPIRIGAKIFLHAGVSP